MNTKIVLLLAVLLVPAVVNGGEAKDSKIKDLNEIHSRTNSQEPIGKQGLVATYRHESGSLIPGSVVRNFTLALGPLEDKKGSKFQWLHLQATQANGEQFNVWILTDRYPPASVTAARETTARYILQEGNSWQPPSSMVFEPPGRMGTLRTLPEMNMAYLCQIPVENPKNLIGIIYGFLRGAARLTNKGWGTSIYGQVDRADSFWFLTHAYDLGARLFFFWDSHRLACVPYNECLALARNLRAHVEAHPYREMKKLKRAAEVAILLPPGYNLGHVYMGKGNLWGLGELNLERVNREGVKYRMVMGNFFTEIERCIRMGAAYDLFWDIEGYKLPGYREVVHIRETGKVMVMVDGKKILHNGPRIPDRPKGVPPQLAIELSIETGKAPLEVAARAFLTEGSSPIYYTLGADPKGIYKNVKVFWELYGPGEEDYRFLLNWNRE